MIVYTDCNHSPREKKVQLPDIEWQELQRILAGLFGVLFLVSGARLYRVLIMLPGAVAGIILGLRLSAGAVEEVQLFSIVFCAVCGLVFSFLLEKAMIAVAGALFGGGLVHVFLPIVTGEEPIWYAPLIGAVFGGMILFPIFPRLIPILSSAAGAFLLLWATHREGDIVLLSALTFFGWILQRFFGVTRASIEED